MDSNFEQLPAIILKGKVFFPNRKVSFDIMDKKSANTLAKATKENKFIFFTTQKKPDDNDIIFENIYKIGVIGKAEQILKLPNGITRVFAECFGKYKIEQLYIDNNCLFADITEVIDFKHIKSKNESQPKDFEYRALQKLLLELFEEYSSVGKTGPEFIMEILSSDDVEHISYLLGEKIPFAIHEKQRILEETDVYKRAQITAELLNKEINALNVKKRIYSKVRTKIDKTQREYFLREEIKIIQEELGESDDILSDIKEYTKRMEKSKNMPEAVKKRLEKEIMRLKRMGINSSAEGIVSRDYIELILDMPWGIFNKENDDIKKAHRIFDKDHYGLMEVKERIIEFLAVRKISNNINAPIICLVGPPGVGKTSIAKSVAKVLNRKYVRMSLGGISDEAEIRGHRKTYVGAMPGRIVSSIKNAKTMNPLILFDEIDKIRNERYLKSFIYVYS